MCEVRDSSRRARKEGGGDGAGLTGGKVASQKGPGSELKFMTRKSDWSRRLEEGGGAENLGRD